MTLGDQEGLVSALRTERLRVRELDREVRRQRRAIGQLKEERTRLREIVNLLRRRPARNGAYLLGELRRLVAESDQIQLAEEKRAARRARKERARAARDGTAESARDGRGSRG